MSSVDSVNCYGLVIVSEGVFFGFFIVDLDMIFFFDLNKRFIFEIFLDDVCSGVVLNFKIFFKKFKKVVGLKSCFLVLFVFQVKRGVGVVFVI